MKLSLHKKILILVLGLLLVSITLIGSAVLLSTSTAVQMQAKEKLETGQRVFERLLTEHGSQLLDSASVLVSDFGFKQAVTSQDIPTIESALENTGARIDANLIALVSPDGMLVAQIGKIRGMASADLKPLLDAAVSRGSHSTIALIDTHILQLVVLPVKAPLPVAWIIIGLEIDQNFAAQIKGLTNLDVSFLAEREQARPLSVSTLAQALFVTQPEDEAKARFDMHLEHSSRGEEYMTLPVPLVRNQQYQITAQLHASLHEANEIFRTLQMQILSIAALALVLSILGALLTSRTVTRPIADLVQATERISLGNYQQQLCYDRKASAEIVALGQSFATMQQVIAEREELLSRQAYVDPLTGLSSRAAISDFLDQLLRMPPSTFCVMRLNINGFKMINDTFGYEIGDEVLKSMAQTLRSLIPGAGHTARLGADEFAAVLVESDVGRREALILELIELIQRPIAQAKVSACQIRIGIAVYPEHGGESETLLRRAEIALNHAKDQKLSYAYYLAGQDESHRRQIRLVADLKVAIAQSRLELFYQPKYDIKAARVTQVEALLRWIHEDFGFVPPDEFVALAEQSGLMPLLSQWVIEQAARQCRAWKDKWTDRNQRIAIAINLSAYDVNEKLPQKLALVLKDNGIDASDLILEITESAFMENTQQAIIILNQLRQMGFPLSIDDYGTGYSSLGQLKNMPVHELKIDKSFVLNLDKDSNDQLIVRSTIELARTMGLGVVAEGVETIEACHLLRHWGCDKLQGYYFSKPLPAAKFEDWLEQSGQQFSELFSQTD